MSRGKNAIAETGNHVSLITFAMPNYRHWHLIINQEFPSSSVIWQRFLMQPFLIFTSRNAFGGMTIARFRSPAYLLYQRIIRIFPSCSKKQPTKTTTKHTKTYKNQEAEKVLRCWSLPFCFSWVFHCGDRAPSSHDSCNSPSHPWSCATPPGFHLNGREQQGWNTWGPWNFPKILLSWFVMLEGNVTCFYKWPIWNWLVFEMILRQN